MKLALALITIVLLLTGCDTKPRPDYLAATTRPVALSPATRPFNTPMGVQVIPTLRAYLPEPATANGAAVVVCPGGGYQGLMDTYEGEAVCRWWNDRGVAAFLLRYRVAPDRWPAPLDDAQAAIRMVRAGAKSYRVDPHKVGIMGFSAGGHLSAAAATLWTSRADRPDFAVLVYPVIQFAGPHAHTGSRDNTIGPTTRPGLADHLSLDRRVTARTPPCFLVHGRDDKIVDYHNATAFADALKSHHVPHHLLILDHGPHGFGLKTPGDQPPWTDRCVTFLTSVGVLPRAR
jgi:acetyl esterase/lipase